MYATPTAYNITWGTNQCDGPLVVGCSVGAGRHKDCIEAGIPVETFVVWIVRIEQEAGIGLVHELLMKDLITVREVKNVAGIALPFEAVQRVVNTEAIMHTYDLQSGCVVSEPH